MPNKLNMPVFYDPQSRRWRRFKRLGQVIGLLLVGIFVPLIASAFIHPHLPSLNLAAAHNNKYHHSWFGQYNMPLTPKATEEISQKPQKVWKKYVADAHLPAVTAAPTSPPTSRSEIIGFYVNWDDNSFTSLKRNISRIDKLLPEWLHLSNSDGAIAIDDLTKQNKAVDYIRQKKPNLAIVPLINNYDSQTQNWNEDRLAKMLNNPTARGRFIQNLLEFVRSNKFAGIHICFQQIATSNQPKLVEFMREIYAQFHPLGLEVSQSVPVDDTAFDFRSLAKFNDYLVLMSYDEHDSSSEAGPIASQNWYESEVTTRFAEVPPNKYVIAIGNYGYDWQDKTKVGEEVGFQDALRIAQESEAEIKFDANSLNPTFDYYDDKYRLHHIWFLDAVTAFNQMVEGQRYQTRGFALWRLGSEDPSVWEAFDRNANLDAAATVALQKLQYGYDIDYEGKGEVLKVTATPAEGVRQVTYDKQTRLVTNEKLISYASPYVITRWGGESKKKIALTFDDGPDPSYTSDILDILGSYKAKATFFVIGMNASLHPELLQQIADEGHEIGSHTFTHPNIAMISDDQLDFELNTNERLIQSILGVGSVLFRPPYAEDVEPETPDQVKPLLFTGKLGYYTIGMQIDPNDWHSPGVDKIVSETIAQAEAGLGNVVLLHDSGGDRSQTVAALPQIIEGLRAKGFELVTVSNLIGLTRNAVMPPIPQNEQVMTQVNGAGFLLINWFSGFSYYLFVVAIGLSVMRLLFIGTLAVYEWFKRRRTQYSPTYLPSVSVIVPAFNEEKVVLKTIYSLLKSNYPNFNIIAVDDGSIDRTYQILVEAFQDEPRVRIFTKPNGGKSQALNYGITHTEAEIVVTLDADTILSPDAIEFLVRHFVKPEVGAIAGNAKVGNRINLLTRWQALEYITSQNLERRAFGLLNCISVVPGAIGAWRRELILQAGGFANDTLAEDADLTLKILRMGYKIDYDEDAIALTEAPDTIGGFLKQRFRWMYGTSQAVWKHRDTLFRRRYGALGMFAVPNVALFQIAFPLVSPLMDLLMILSIVWAVWQQHQHPGNFSLAGLDQLIFFYVLFLAVDFLAASIAFMLEKKEDWRLLIWLLPQRFGYRQLMYYVAIKSTFTAIKGQIVGWGKADRKATVPSH